jgi:15,16-dihydrobiliverdin:ferredoxin oxidoreductase
MIESKSNKVQVFNTKIMGPSHQINVRVLVVAMNVLAFITILPSSAFFVSSFSVVPSTTVQKIQSIRLSSSSLSSSSSIGATSTKSSTPSTSLWYMNNDKRQEPVVNTVSVNGTMHHFQHHQQQQHQESKINHINDHDNHDNHNTSHTMVIHKSNEMDMNMKIKLCVNSLNNNEEHKEIENEKPMSNSQLDSHSDSDSHSQSHVIESMPWITSISPSYKNHNQTLPFMPYYTFSKTQLLSKLQNVRPYIYHDNNDKNHKNHNYNNNNIKNNKYHYNQKQTKARIINESYQSDEYRKIRLTYYDGGDQIQVFNSLWYPRCNLGFDVPLLGIDLICFNGKKCLCVVDFQPLTSLYDSNDSNNSNDDDNDNDNNNSNEKVQYDGTKASTSVRVKENDDSSNEKHWEDHLKTIWDDLPSKFKGKMSQRFYDEHQFFSNYMIFGRFDIENDSIIEEGGELWDAFLDYSLYHLELVQGKYKHKQYDQTTSRTNNDGITSVNDDNEADVSHVETLIQEGQRHYDQYSAERDPAKPMFCKMFGDEWGNGYVHNFLFDLSSEDS